jgi:hypothetical protein
MFIHDISARSRLCAAAAASLIVSGAGSGLGFASGAGSGGEIGTNMGRLGSGLASC